MPCPGAFFERRMVVKNDKNCLRKLITRQHGLNRMKFIQLQAPRRGLQCPLELSFLPNSKEAMSWAYSAISPPKAVHSA
jgi:hypothetical protein